MTEQISADPIEDARHARFVELQDTGDPALRDELVHAHLLLARHLASRFANRGVPFEDLFQVASLGLVHAVDRFDPSMGVPFGAFATPTILGEIKRHFRDRSWDLRIPRRMQELHLEVNAVVGQLTQELGRSPTVGELAAATRSSDEEVVEAIEAGRAFNVSTIEPSSTARPSSEVERALLTDDMNLQNAEVRLLVERLLSTLAPREQLIMRLRFWEHLSQDEIARRLGISQMHVSRLLARSLAALQEHLGENPLDA